MSAALSDQYTIRDMVHDVLALVEQHGQDGPKLLAGLREPYSRILAGDLSRVGVKREGNHIDNSRYLYYDGQMSITFDQLPKGKRIPPHDHGVWEAMGIYSGQLKHVVYDRLDDGTKEGYAELKAIDDRILQRNDTAIVAPPAEIHSFEALTDDTFAVTIVGGQYKLDRAYYQPDKKTYVRLNPKKDKVV